MRSIDNIYQTLLESFRERAGFAPDSGCDLAVRLWAAAAEIQALELQAAWVLDQCFPQTAQGLYLDRHPFCQKGLAYYQKHRQMRDEAAAAYQAQFGPLNIRSNNDPDRWTWVDSPWPWEMEA